MTMTPHTLICQTFLDLTLDAKRRVDAVCVKFEAAGRVARIEDFLPLVSPSLRGALLTELIALEIEMLRGSGEASSTAEYIERFPDGAGSVRAAFGQQTVVAVGATLGRYKLTGILGRGGMGVVYEAVDPLIDRMVAIKVLPDRLLAEPRAHDRLLQEARLAGQVLHPNVVALFEAGETEGSLFLVLELVRGGNAAERVKRDGVLDWRTATRIAADVCRGLTAIHDSGFLHLDIKPANVLLPGEGGTLSSRSVLAKLSDFSLSMADAEGSELGIRAGTPSYMSPEQRTSSVLTQRTDIFGVGATYYTLLTGRPPFAGSSVTEIVADQVRQPERDPREVNPSIPEPVARIVRRAMAVAPEDRYASAADFLNALEIALDPRRPRARRRFYVALGAACVLALAVFVGSRFLPEEKPKSPVASIPRVDGWEPLLDGQDLVGWRTIVPDGGDPAEPSEFRIVELDGGPVLQASGTGLGAIESEREFENYHLRFEYRWGAAGGTHLASIRYHCTGEFASKGTHGMQLHAQAAGSYLRLNELLKIDTGEIRDGKVVSLAAGGKSIPAQGAREVAAGRWNKASLICVDDWAVHVINEKPVLALAKSRKVDPASDQPLTRGRIRFQSLKGEIFFRKIEVRKVTELPAQYRVK